MIIIIILSRSIPEIWKSIKDVVVNGNKFDLYYDYTISNYGNLKMNEKNINLILDRKYYYASLYVIYNNSKKRLKIKVSRIVCREFNGEPKSYDYECHHINCIHTDNRSDNLIWLSPEQHRLITTANGQHPKGDLSSGRKLNEEIVNIVIKLLLNKFTDTEIRDFIHNEYKYN